jgi:plastocyanin domain-containing protein
VSPAVGRQTGSAHVTRDPNEEIVMNLKTLAMAVLVMLVAGCSSPVAARVQRVKIEVTEKGFVPETVTVQSGRPVTLLVTRRTEATCATRLVLKTHGIDEKLPLGKTVAITFRPERAGTLTYACPMDMIHGTILVR